MNPTKIGDNRNKRDAKGRFPKGVVQNPEGRAVGSISPITKVRQIFREDPNGFEAWVKEYIKDPKNRRHIVEMLDGSPKHNVDVTTDGEKLEGVSIMNVDLSKLDYEELCGLVAKKDTSKRGV